MERQFDTHHIWWNRTSYRTPAERRLRHHPAFVIRDVWIPQHKLLHAELPQPPKPNHQIIAGILLNLEMAEDSGAPFNGLINTIDFLSESDLKGTDRMATHLIKQLVILGADYGTDRTG